MASTALTNKIDKALANYYGQLGRDDYTNHQQIGKFTLFVNSNAYEDDDVKEELEVEDVNDCILTDFDVDDDGKNQFPFNEPIDDDNDKNEEIFRILKHIAKHGSYGTKNETRNITLDPSMCFGITKEDMDRVVQKYKAQMQCLGDKFEQYGSLSYFFAVSEKVNYPFITYIVDRYTSDAVKYFAETKEPLSVAAWSKNNSFILALKRKYPNNDISKKLESAMEEYSTRIMQRLLLTPFIKIKDSLKAICEYVVVIPALIQKLMDSFYAVPPFQVDLIIAVKGVKSVVSDAQIENDDDDDIGDEKSYVQEDLDPTVDQIGDVKTYLQRYPVAHFYRDDNLGEIDKTELLRNALVRNFAQRWNDWTTALSKFNETSKKDNSHNDDEKEPIKYDAKTYPQNKRFSIFVDRRENKNDDQKTKNDEIIYFQPPDICNRIESDHVPEIAFELIRKCVIPKGSKNNSQSIDATTDVCGQLITFMFNVEQKDEIRCYIVWNGQTMRFEGKHMMLVLPYLFEESEENINFIQQTEALTELERLFVEQMKDTKYDAFSQELETFGANKSQY